MKLLFILSIYFVILIPKGQTQSCCSGGVPVSSNIGFQSTEAHIFQLNISADFNFLKTLKSEGQKLDDDQRLRTTQSYIIRGGYSFNNSLTFEMLFPLIRQTRRITTLGGTNIQENTFGVGDPLALLIYNFLYKDVVFRIGAGPQFPLGDYDQKNSQGLTLLEDLQPGSGAWDVILFGSLEYQLKNRPSSFFYLNTIISKTGSNPNSRGGFQTYEFGDDIQIISGFSDQVLFLGQIITPGISVRYRHADRDKVDQNKLPGTGGDFLFGKISNSFPFPKLKSSLGINFELPLWTRVNDTQLSPSFAINISWFKSFNPQLASSTIIDVNEKF